MQLLIQRGQRTTAILNNNRFTLWAKYELTQNEVELVRKYDIYDTILVEGKPRELRRAAIWAIIPTFIILMLFTLALPAEFHQPQSIIAVALLVYPLSVFLIYNQIRQLVKVSDLLDGRTFPCKSVVGLLVKEKEITDMSLAFRHLLEALKNWRAREIVKLEPYVASTVPMIEKQP